jgi:ribosome-associated protein
MQSQELKNRVCQAIEDAKGIDIKTMDVRTQSDITDFMIVASGTSSRHVASVADRVTEIMGELGQKALGVEGKSDGDWVLLDFGDVVVHIMRPETRDFYNLEKLWGEIQEPGALKR